jgi:hypothetical protein
LALPLLQVHHEQVQRPVESFCSEEQGQPAEKLSKPEHAALLEGIQKTSAVDAGKDGCDSQHLQKYGSWVVQDHSITEKGNEESCIGAVFIQKIVFSERIVR